MSLSPFDVKEHICGLYRDDLTELSMTEVFWDMRGTRLANQTIPLHHY